MTHKTAFQTLVYMRTPCTYRNFKSTFSLKQFSSNALFNRAFRYQLFLVGIRLKAGESNGKLPRTCPGCSVPEPYRSHDWALVPANPASKAEY